MDRYDSAFYIMCMFFAFLNTDIMNFVNFSIIVSFGWK